MGIPPRRVRGFKVNVLATWFYSAWNLSLSSARESSTCSMISPCIYFLVQLLVSASHQYARMDCRFLHSQESGVVLQVGKLQVEPTLWNAVKWLHYPEDCARWSAHLPRRPDVHWPLKRFVALDVGLGHVSTVDWHVGIWDCDWINSRCDARWTVGAFVDMRVSPRSE